MEEVLKIVSLLDDNDKKTISEFADVLLQKNKYNKLRKELESRRAEIKNGEVLSHKDIWQDIL